MSRYEPSDFEWRVIEPLPAAATMTRETSGPALFSCQGQKFANGRAKSRVDVVGTIQRTLKLFHSGDEARSATLL